MKALPNGEAWLASVERADQGSATSPFTAATNLDISNGHDRLVDVSAAWETTFTGTRAKWRERLAQFEARVATGIISGPAARRLEWASSGPMRRLPD